LLRREDTASIAHAKDRFAGRRKIAVLQEARPLRCKKKKQEPRK